ncbi:MAG: tRNA (adenosine(37)-N6)-threonylcarbamoyltransferase complex ATPase subunit type 1 TsaE [Bacteroidota bacterium]|nr:tRNA (adenosine(37)-N6)-threonylcarbamoyltransferase complex ATPase subunit type 1 TsaE [Bacteroidota bacterium]
MQLKLVCENVHSLDSAASRILSAFSGHRVFALYGSMGAGKTTFIKALCRKLHVKDVVNSPTFAIVNEYLDTKGESVYHFDFYRLKKESEAIEIGYEEYVYSGCYCFMEWPEKIENLLPEGYVRIDLVVDNETEARTISCSDSN